MTTSRPSRGVLRQEIDDVLATCEWLRAREAQWCESKLDGRIEPSPTYRTWPWRGLQNFDDIFIWLGLVALRPHLRRSSTSSTAKWVHIPSEPELRAKFNQTGNFAVSSTPEEFAAFISGSGAGRCCGRGGFVTIENTSDECATNFDTERR
jgi:hypothetical protein